MLLCVKASGLWMLSMCLSFFAPSVVDVSYRLAAEAGSFACVSLSHPERLTWPIYRWDSGTSSGHDPVITHQVKGDKADQAYVLPDCNHVFVSNCQVLFRVMGTSWLYYVHKKVIHTALTALWAAHPHTAPLRYGILSSNPSLRTFVCVYVYTHTFTLNFHKNNDKSAYLNVIFKYKTRDWK